QRLRDHIVFSVVAIGVLCIVLRLLGMRSTVAGFAFSVGITLALNVGLSYYNDYRARSPKRRTVPAGGGDIRWREDEAPLRGGAGPAAQPRSREADLRRREEDLDRREREVRLREQRNRETRSGGRGGPAWLLGRPTRKRHATPPASRRRR